MQTTSNIWDDSECTVEEEYSSSDTSNSPNLSLEFRNSLINNKGDIKSARKFTFDLTHLTKAKSQQNHKDGKLRINYDSNTEKEVQLRSERPQKNSSFLKPVSENKKWKQLCNKRREMPSVEIIKSMNN